MATRGAHQDCLPVTYRSMNLRKGRTVWQAKLILSMCRGQIRRAPDIIAFCIKLFLHNRLNVELINGGGKSFNDVPNCRGAHFAPAFRQRPRRNLMAGKVRDSGEWSLPL